ncbi:coagulation factor XIII A chain-like [Kryptolebias marmoratus]|uniref:coagulation factor XIII A chain-like n=1 Tax=Kryptolebias marmoratus TaxID=37003 RepID=UPI0007F87F34|nr:coagulation factor XIII A chain-like [Kryptolebias marmoratus]XP_037829070.1 coagulation factor XIII A chain-like [Kryptolebias marmoratus]
MRKSYFSGRFPNPVPSTNLLLDDGADFKQFEPFEGEADAAPRAPPPGAEPLQVVDINMKKAFNEGNHFTNEYMTNLLVVRRGQQFVIDVSCNRPLQPEDDFQVEFLIGSDPTPNKDSMVVVTFGNRSGGSWGGQILGSQGAVVSLGITPHPRAIVGLYRTYVAVSTGNGMQRTEKNPNTNLYVLFNPWSQDDEVFYPDDAGRWEYVLNSTGIIYQGTSNQVSERGWVFGQFEAGVLDACIYILDVCRMPIESRGDVIKVLRTASAMINSQDDNGVLVGNWGEDFSMGVAPTTWTGSAKILLQYHNTGAPVSFAQCWVYAGVLNTFMRCLGIPARVITNFNSAHDNTGNLKTELIFMADGSPDRRRTRDSIWNYHCWNEAYIKRVDLPPKYSGWQVVDATPQETSDGFFRCGPAPVIAVKDGELYHPFDCGFVFAEVNSDLVHMKSDKYGNLSPFKVDTTYVGILIYTKAMGGWSPENVTHTYKYPEGSPQDQQTMAKAEEFGMSRDHSELPETKLALAVRADPRPLGETVNVMVTFYNQSEQHKTVKAHLEVSIAYYTGVVSQSFRSEDFSLQVPSFQKNSAMFDITPQEYMPHLGSKAGLHIVVTGQTETDKVSEIMVVALNPPPINISLSGRPQVNQEMYVTVSFKNSLQMTLYNAKLVIEGAGLLEHREFHYNTIGPFAEISQKVKFSPQKPGLRTIVAVLDSQNLPEVTAMVEVKIMP